VSPSITELFILSLIDRGLKSKYDLQRKAGISLGSSSPALIRMQAAKLVIRDVDSSQGKRPRHELRLSVAGKKLAREGWRSELDNLDGDIESVLRLVDIASHYGAKPSEISKLLVTAASTRPRVARSSSSTRGAQTDTFAIAATQAQWELAKSRAETRVLLKLANSADADKSTRSTKPTPAKRPRTRS
jgi:DNA-binding PadR family transcriptional regulator